jgi:AraC-like DNA-binding protein
MVEKEENRNNKSGYLEKDFEFFHLRDNKGSKLDLHYHDFNKIIIFISGKVTYFIEGKSYRLRPWDILLVSSDEVHWPLIDTNETYERMVIWVNSSFLAKHSSGGSDLLTCFELAVKQKFNLLRLSGDRLKELKAVLAQFETSCKSTDFGSQILRNSLFLQFIVQVNRLYLQLQDSSYTDSLEEDITYDEQIGSVLGYINENLCGDLSIEGIAESFYMSKYHLMHKFKGQTGYTIHNYIIQKRLLLANSMIKKGRSVTDACIECGFGDYSSFVRAFKKMFGLSPKKHYKKMQQLQDTGERKEHF